MRPDGVVPLSTVPITGKAATKWIRERHRHLKRLNDGARFSVAISDGQQIRGVAIVGNGPAAWEGSTKAVITRCCTDGVVNGCSMLYGALARAALALGYTEIWTYTLPEEPGASLRAAGFRDKGMTAGGSILARVVLERGQSAMNLNVDGSAC